MVDFVDVKLESSNDQNREVRSLDLEGSGTLEVKTSNEVMKAENAFSYLMMKKKISDKSPTRLRSKKRMRKLKK